MPGPESAHSPNAEELNALYWVLLAVAGVLVLAINGALLALALRYRAARGREPRRLQSRRGLQTTVAAGLGALALAIFAIAVIANENASEVEKSGSKGLQASSRTLAQRDLRPPDLGEDDAEPLEVEAAGQQWVWRYEYPDGTFSYYELVVPADTAIVVNLASTDVVHRWWVPGLGGKFDATPGSGNRTWFKVDSEELEDDDEFAGGALRLDGQSYGFSGASYATMRTEVVVVTPEDYEAWLQQQSADIQEAQAAVQQRVAGASQEPATGSQPTEQ